MHGTIGWRIIAGGFVDGSKVDFLLFGGNICDSAVETCLSFLLFCFERIHESERKRKGVEDFWRENEIFQVPITLYRTYLRHLKNRKIIITPASRHPSPWTLPSGKHNGPKPPPGRGPVFFTSVGNRAIFVCAPLRCVT